MPMPNIPEVSKTSRALIEVQKGTDYFVNLNHVGDPYICRAVRKGSRCQNTACKKSDEQQIDNLWSLFCGMTECPQTDQFYGQLGNLIRLTHCTEHRGSAVRAFEKWKTERQAAPSWLPVASPTSARTKQRGISPQDAWMLKRRDKMESTSASNAEPYLYSTAKINDRFDNEPSEYPFNRPQSKREMMAKPFADSWKLPFEHYVNLKPIDMRIPPPLEARTREEPLADLAKHITRRTWRIPSREQDEFQESQAEHIPSARTMLDFSWKTPASDDAFWGSEPIESDYADFFSFKNTFNSGVKGISSEAMQQLYSKQPTPQIVDQDTNDTATEYSDESTCRVSKKQDFIWGLANELSKAISPLEVDEKTQERVSNALPELLKAFALKVGHGAETQVHRDAMVFVQKYRNEIAAVFTDISFKKHSDDFNQKKRGAEEMSWQDRTNFWFEKSSFKEPPEELPQSVVIDGKASEEKFPSDDEQVLESWPIAFLKFLTSSSAYEELLARLRRELYLVPAELDIMKQIREEIMLSLPSPHKISRKIPPGCYHAEFQVDWDILGFFNTQDYSKEPYEIFERVITVTGSCQDAQAATCAQYIKQTWPMTGEIVIQLIKDVLMEECHPLQLPDGTEIMAWIRTPEFIFKVHGVAVSVAEIGELISWLGAALRISPQSNGLICCLPNVRNTTPNIGPLKLPVSSIDPVYKIGYTMETIPQALTARNGQCWHNILRNPVVVRGYPIPQRVEWNNGLEVSLNIMAGLAHTRRLDKFKEKLYIKGFSTLLFPTRKNEDIICWHLIYNKNGDRISYLDDDRDQEEYIGQMNLENYRHVLGWCSEAKVYAGSAEAHHPVTHSRLPKPHIGCSLSGLSVSEGKILKGPAFSIGARDTPVYVSRKGYVRQLRWMSRQLILLWDERDKRGWLINGTTALLHIVRAFLSHAKNDDFKDAFRFSEESLQESKAPFTTKSAIDVLIHPNNRRLELYEEVGCDDKDLFGTQIDHVYNLLEKLIDHQADISRHHGSKLNSTPRRYLEGWDFKDVATECPTIYPRVATIADPGKGWIDFIRAISAVTLVGQGFGDIIKPAGRNHCDSWATLPTNKYYIASCISDLDYLLEKAGSHPDGHALLCDNLIYHTPPSVRLACQCKRTPGQEHCEPVRTVIPAGMSTILPCSNLPIQSNGQGAVILGYNSRFPLIWGDTGSPQLAELLETDPPSEAIEEDVDSRFGSISTASELENPTAPQSESQTEYSAIPNEIRQEAVKKVASRLSITIFNDTYTRGDYTIGIICPLAKELKAVRALFDNVHGSLSPRSTDGYPYVFGDMGGHWVVAACLPEYGTNPAAAVAANMKVNFRSVQFCLLIGIAGGVPLKENDVRLGDVVVSYPTGTISGVIQYDLGKEEDGNSFQLTGSLQRPPLELMAAINTLKSDLDAPESQLEENLRAITDRLPDYKYPGEDSDVPYRTACASCVSHRASPEFCSHIQQRVPRTTTLPTIHYGVIASGNRVIKDAKFRNQLAQERGVLCFEMEAAGVMNTLNCLVIRGISDYCDGQKNDTWQKYAAATAAAYAKLLLGFVPRRKRSRAGSTESNETMSSNKKRKLN